MQWKEFESHVRHFASKELERLQKAFAMGKEAHKEQKRASGEPYFTHPIAVAHKLADMGADPDTLVAALLHDTVEDTDMTLKDIEKIFGKSVAALIDGVTKLSATDVEHSPNMDDKIETLRKIFTLMQEDVRIIVIKLVDRLHNMQTIEYLREEKQKKYAKDTLETYVKIADRLSMADIRDELEALSLSRIDPITFTKLKKLRASNERKGKKVVEKMHKALKTIQPEREFDLRYETKSWTKLQALLQTGNTSITGLATMSVSVVCDSLDSCYQALGTIHQLWRREILSFQDFVSEPTINGYRGLHTTIILDSGTRVRCKIRTEEMQEYAHTGVSMQCFDNEALGLLRYLPWAEKISSLSEDTAQHSKEFWESLQNDILGELIAIHGPDDRTVLVPTGSTALDGAFYCLQKEALKLKSVQINGVEVDFSTPLEKAVTLDTTLGKQRTVERDWLRCAHSGYAVAKIREALTDQPHSKRVNIGKQLLQDALKEQKKGYIEELGQERIKNALKSLGYSSLNSAYLSLAEGHLEAIDIIQAVFAPKKESESEKKDFKLRFIFPVSDAFKLSQLYQLYRKYKVDLGDIRLRFDRNTQEAHVGVKISAAANQQDSIISDHKHAGARNITLETMKAIRTRLLFASLLIILWGLDPVFAKVLLNAGVAPLSFTYVRVLSIFVCAVGLLFYTQQHKQFTRIPLNHSALWIAGITFFCIALFNYIALSLTTAATYNTVIRGNSILIMTPLLFKHKHHIRLVITWILAVAGVTLLSYAPGTQLGLLYTICVVGLFALYTASSSYFQRTAHVESRYPQFFFCMSLIAIVCCIPFLLTTDIETLPPHLLLATALFSISFVGAPYILFYALMQRWSYSNFSRCINVSLVITLGAQWLMFGTEGWLVFVFAGACLIIANLVSWHRENPHHH